MASVHLKGVCKRFGKSEIIKNVDIPIEDGEFVVFVGPSGCGKSTLLRMIAGLEDVSEGDLYIGGQRVNALAPRERGIAMVFQSYAIFPHMTVRENVAFGLTISGMAKAEKDQRVMEAARILQMEHLLERRPTQLSGGQRQRVAIGRAIVRHPQVFLFDEPLSNLDAALRLSMRMEIGKLHKQLGATMIYVTHDQTEAMTLADKIVVLRDGEVQQIGSPMALYHHPANRFVAGFLGSPSMNFLDVDVAAQDSRHVQVHSPVLNAVTLENKSGLQTGPALLGVRPQDLQPVDGKGLLQGRVTLVERLGTETVIDLQAQDGNHLLCTLPRDSDYAIGDTLHLSFDPTRAHLFGRGD